MNIIDAEKVEITPTPHKVATRKLFDTEHAQVVHITLQPGEALKKHITPVDVFFYVLEGEGVIEISDEKKTAGPNTLIESPKGIPHTWYNESDSIFKVLVVKTPRPKTPRPVGSTRML